jgi:transposase-like protein
LPKRYPAEFRRRVLDLVAEGRKVTEIAHDLGLSPQTIYSWRRQAEIDDGQRPGLRTAEAAELVAARRELRRLREENAILRRSSELLRDASSPKGGSRRSR